MAAVAAGVLAALWAAACSSPAPRSTAVLGWVGLGGVASDLLFEDLLWKVLGQATMLVLTGGAAFLVIAFDRGWRAGRAPAWTGWLQSLGRLSYEVYLTHMFVVLPAVASSIWPGLVCASDGFGIHRCWRLPGRWAGRWTG